VDRFSNRIHLLVVAILAAGVAAEGWAAPIRLAPFDARGNLGERDAYEYLRSLPGGPVMELPTVVERSDPEFIFQYMTLLHHHRIVNGHSGYVTPLLRWLGGGHSPFWELEHQSDAINMLRGIGVRYLVVHRHLYDDRALADAMLGVIERDPAQVIAH